MARFVSVAPVQFFAAGTPRTKGSTRSFAHAATGKVVTLGANKRTKSWQGVIAHAANEAGATPAAKGEAVDISVVFTFSRPKSHYGTGRNAERLKPSAPARPTTRKQGDLDKLLRALLDGLDGVAYEDDSQVASIRCAKEWRDGSKPEGALVTIMPARVYGEGGAF